MRSIYLAAMVALAATAPGTAPAQTAPDAIVRSLATDPAIPAVAAGRVSADALSFAVAGNRVREGEAAQPGDAWHVGSLTKSMTATLAARLVDRGLIEWDSTIGNILGPDVPGMHADWADTPLHLLLTHGSGMVPNLDGVTPSMTEDGFRQEYVAEVLSQPRAEPPGGFLYSNAGYVVAGAMLEAAGGAPWEELITAEVFGPMGITSAGFGPPQGAAVEGHDTSLFRGLRPVGQDLGADNIPALGPAGRVHLNTEDMLRYLRAHLVQDEAYLSAENWARLHRPQGPQDYAMGWGVGEDGSLVHSGSNTFWYAVAFIDMAGGQAVFVAINSGDLGEIAGPVDQALRELLTGPAD